MKKSLILIILVTSIFSQKNGNPRESWYLQFGIGTADLSYPAYWNDIIDSKLDGQGKLSGQLSYDLLGVYFHLDEQTLLGGILSFTSTRFDHSPKYIQLNVVSMGLSSLYYLDDSFFGEGFFLRGDLTGSYVGSSDEKDSITKSDFGFGVQIGGGYSFDIIDSRLLCYALISRFTIEDRKYSSLSLSLGFLL